jgi:hypothetical protein
MSFCKITSCAAVAGFAALLGASQAQAGMYPAVSSQSPSIIHTDCAVGFHLGPVGTCVMGTDDARPAPPVEERRATDEGCETRSVNRTDAAGNSETHTRTNCN